MKKYTSLSLMLFSVIIIAMSSCSKKDAAVNPNNPVSYDGTWSGTTSQGKAINFTVSGGAITSVYIGYSLSGGCGAVPAGETITFYTPRYITGNNFSITGNTEISGSFSSGNKVSGSFTKTFSGLSGCTATASGSWTASK